MANPSPAPAPEGEATLFVGPVILLNNTNGKLEHISLGSITPGLTTANAASMLTSLAEVQKAWAEKTELTTDATSADE